MSNNKSGGIKEAIGKHMEKPRLSLIPKEILWEMGKAFGHGEFKYGTNNYKLGIPITYSLDGAMRHIQQFLDGENFDSETKVHHLGAAATNLAMAVWMYYNKPELDDRFKKNEKA